MAFSFVKAFLSAFRPLLGEQARRMEDYRQRAEREKEIIEQKEREREVDEFLLSEWEKEARREREKERPDIPVAQPVTLEEGFLEAGQWLFAVQSHHVNAMKYDPENKLLTVSYKRGDVWEYDPISLTLAEKFAKDLQSGSPGTDVWSFLRWRPSEGAPNMRSHRPWINARQIAGAGD